MKRLVIIVSVLCFIITGDLFTQEKGMQIIGKASGADSSNIEDKIKRQQ